MTTPAVPSELIDDARALVAAFIEGAAPYESVLRQIIAGDPDPAARLAGVCMGAVGLTAALVRSSADHHGVPPSTVLLALARAAATPH